MNYDPKRILAGAVNARDLGGIETKYGKVRSGKLLRSGELSLITDEDAEYLKSVRLKTVIDLRTPQEIRRLPDRVLDGVTYVRCPIIEGKADGITKEMPRDPDELAVFYVEQAARITERAEGWELMRGMYGALVKEPFARRQYAKFLRLLAENRDGAALYHCTMGKDRVGVGTLFILTLLGADRDAVMTDYLYTRERLEPRSQDMLMRCSRLTSDEKCLETIYAMDTVREDMLTAAIEAMEAECGSVEGYIRDALGITEREIEALREIYIDR